MNELEFKKTVESKFNEIIDQAKALLGDNHGYINNIYLTFNIKGYTIAGRARPSKNEVQINPNYWKTEEARTHVLERTITHEIAHIINHYHGGRGHDRGWKRIMTKLGVDPDRCHGVDIEALGMVRNTFTYVCACDTFELSKTRHNRIMKGKKYRCVSCKTPLTYKG